MSDYHIMNKEVPLYKKVPVSCIHRLDQARGESRPTPSLEGFTTMANYVSRTPIYLLFHQKHLLLNGVLETMLLYREIIANREII